MKEKESIIEIQHKYYYTLDNILNNILFKIFISIIPIFGLLLKVKIENLQKDLVKLTDIFNFQNKIEKEIQKLQDIHEITNNIQTIKIHYEVLVRLKQSYILKQVGLFYRLPKIYNFIFDQNKIIQSIILDHILDLANGLNQQKNILESAKSEVEKNIAGTIELNQVSELQRARLDRQIEQFKELQRVLVKV